jgi:hypothetical protein
MLGILGFGIFPLLVMVCVCVCGRLDHPLVSLACHATTAFLNSRTNDLSLSGLRWLCLALGAVESKCEPTETITWSGREVRRQLARFDSICLQHIRFLSPLSSLGVSCSDKYISTCTQSAFSRLDRVEGVKIPRPLGGGRSPARAVQLISPARPLVVGRRPVTSWNDIREAA